MDIKPTRGKILGKILPEDTQSDTITIVKLGKQIPSRIKVVAVGASKTGKKGKEIKQSVSIGDIAHIKRHSGMECRINQDTFAFVQNDDIVARENEKGIHAVKDNILVQTEYEEQSGIIIPDHLKKTGGCFHGRVVAVGPEYMHRVSVGDKIRFERHEGHVVMYKHKEYLSLKNKWVVGVEYD